MKTKLPRTSLDWVRKTGHDTEILISWYVGEQKLVQINQKTGEVVITPLTDPEIH